MKRIDAVKFFVSIAVVQLIGNIGALATIPALSWYESLVVPAFSPPSWIFAPVWIVIYFLMGISVFLIWREDWRRPEVKVALGVFAGQLALNIFWPLIFFGFKSPLLAFIEISLLWFSILLNIITFFNVSKAAAWLLMPYIIWVSFASWLNFMTIVLNR